MSFIYSFLVFCIFYALCSFLYKWYVAQPQQPPTGPEFLKSLDEDACGIIFVNQTGKPLSLKITGKHGENPPWTEHFTLRTEGGKLAFFAGTQLSISISDDNYIETKLTEPHIEHTIAISSDYTFTIK